MTPRTGDADKWAGWVPKESATLVFAIQGDTILLIRKKRGLGAGKINGPGGRVDPGESYYHCAVREVQEELGVTPTNVEPVGELCFQSPNFSMYVEVFVADGWIGEPTDTDEAEPYLTTLDDIPYDEMWADDRIWLPFVLAGKAVRARFVFDGNNAIVAAGIEITPTL